MNREFKLVKLETLTCIQYLKSIRKTSVKDDGYLKYFDLMINLKLFPQIPPRPSDPLTIEKGMEAWNDACLELNTIAEFALENQPIGMLVF